MFREVVQNARLEDYAELGLIFFVIAFALVLLRVFFLKREEATHMNELPLQQDEASVAPTAGASGARP